MQLNISASPEAQALIRSKADRMGLTISHLVVEAVRAYDPEALRRAERDVFEMIAALDRRLSALEELAGRSA
jgi:hypothetical protein